MPQIEVLPNSTSIAQPGYAFVPDTRHGPAQAAQPITGRKRAARSSNLTGGDTTVRQQNAVLKHLADLDKDSYRDIHIPVPAKEKDNTGRVSKNKTTPNVRRILMSQKTFANHLADEEAALAQKAPSTTTQPNAPKAPSSTLKRASTSEPTPSTTTALLPHSPNRKPSPPIDPLLKSHIPSAPPASLLEALLSAPPLSYNAARASAPTSGKPLRHFCEICGYWGSIKCMKCGARVCGLECKGQHDDGRCLKFYA